MNLECNREDELRVITAEGKGEGEEEGLDREKELDEVISEAIQFCISRGVMAEWFENNYKEVSNALYWEFSREAELQAISAEGKAEGMEEGLALATKIANYTLKQTPISEIVKATGATEEEILSIRKQIFDV